MQVRGFLVLFGWLAAMLIPALGCAGVTLPAVLGGSTPTFGANVPFTPSLATLAPPTTTPIILINSPNEVPLMISEFFQALSAGNADKAMEFVIVNPPGQSGSAENIRKILREWAAGKHQFAIVEITYLGLVAPGDYRAMPETDPRVARATVKVRVDGVDYAFGLTQEKGGWLIDGLVAPGAPLQSPTP